MSYSFLDLAYDVLKQSPKPLTCQEVWQIGNEHGLASKLQSKGQTPLATLGARLYVEVRDNDESKFISVGKHPARFFLKERRSEISPEMVAKTEREEIIKSEPETTWNECDLHPLLSHFAYMNLAFNRGRPIYTKTINDKLSKKSGYNAWIHPDIVGFSLPLEDCWCPEVIEFNRLSDNNSLRLFSFELKKTLNTGNYREAFFQAVSNSSWAHEGYLVAANILDDPDFLAELERLASSFGIGIIQLDIENVDSSLVLHWAEIKEVLDWETINKLCDQNPDFKKFLHDVKRDFDAKKIYSSDYAEVIKDIKDISGYVQKKLKIHPKG